MQNEITINDRKYTVSVSPHKFIKATVTESSTNLTIYHSELINTKSTIILTEWIKIKARKLITNRVEELAKQFGFTYNKIAIRNQSTRWGSCSSEKNLNFNWKLILAPTIVMDYVIIHELAHTIQMNHSAAFWVIVEKCMPEYKKARLWLKKEGHTLKID